MTQKISIVRLSAAHYQHPDLQHASKFLMDFGLVEDSRHDNLIYYRGFGIDPYVYIAEASPSPTSARHFVGATWVVDTEDDLKLAASLPSATPITQSHRPGGGRAVTVLDPNGFSVTFVHGQRLRQVSHGSQAHSHTTSPDAPSNTAFTKERKGEFRRMVSRPSPVHKIGHYGFMVSRELYKPTLDWYLSNLKLAPTDTVYDPNTGEDLTTFIHIDRGLEFTDHHTFFLGVSATGPPHIHHSSFEVNDMDTQSLGHDWLRNHKWTNCWGIGRHVLGSQIFDYWFDASGNIVEHYSDGDLVNCETPFRREPESPQSLYIWGPNVPLGFLTGNIDDAGKSVVEAPNVLEGKPAIFKDTFKSQ